MRKGNGHRRFLLSIQGIAPMLIWAACSSSSGPMAPQWREWVPLDLPDPDIGAPAGSDSTCGPDPGQCPCQLASDPGNTGYCGSCFDLPGQECRYCTVGTYGPADPCASVCYDSPSKPTCPGQYTIDCNNGSCCPVDYPVCCLSGGGCGRLSMITAAVSQAVGVAVVRHPAALITFAKSLVLVRVVPTVRIKAVTAIPTPKSPPAMHKILVT